MALVQKSNPRRTITLIIVLIAIAVGGVVGLRLLKPKQSGEVSPVSRQRGNDLPTFTAFGEDLYTTDQFKNLHNFLKEGRFSPPSVTGEGNVSPFRTE